MSIKEENQLKRLSNEKSLELTKDQGVKLMMYDGTMNEVRIRDLVGINDYTATLIDYTGLSFFRKAIKGIEIMDDVDNV